MPNRQWIRWALVVFVVFGIFFATLQPSEPLTTKVTLGTYEVTAELAVSEAQWQKGLSGREPLAENTGMLFVFLTDGSWPMWMKDMRMPLDIVWLNSDKQVVHIAKDVPPGSYPDRIESDTPARYVLEVAAGTAEAQNIQEGSVATFALPSE